MGNTSATGGPLQPFASPAPLNGVALATYIQNWIVGLTGLPGDMVRPSFQPEPPNIPNAGTVWCAFTIAKRSSEDWPGIWHQTIPASGGNPQIDYDELQRPEELEVLLSFYDLGFSGLADAYAELMRDGAIIPQNLEYLTNEYYGLGSVGQLQPVPVILKTRWLYRVDLPLMIRRIVARQYPVDTFSIEPQIQVNLQAGSETPLTITSQEEE